MKSTDFEVHDPRFRLLLQPNAFLTRLTNECLWAEGPVYFPATDLLIWSDIPNNRMMRWAPGMGVGVYRAPSNYSNGNTRDREGRLVTCEHGTRRVTRTEHDGSVTVLASHFEGKRLNSPNDVVVDSKGDIWFTDPDYGKSPAYEGVRELDGCHVYRLDPSTGEIRQMTTDFVMPNGLAFSPDESLLYIVDTGSTHVKGGPNHVRRFRVGHNDTLSGGEVIATNAAEKFDGFRLDTEGRLWMGAEDGIHCYLPDGTMIGKIPLPERASNLTFGGENRDRLLITGSTSIYSCKVNVRGTAP